MSEPGPPDPYANKAIVAAVTTVTGVAVQWLSTGTFDLGSEGATTLVGAVVTLLVYAVSNRRKLTGS